MPDDAHPLPTLSEADQAALQDWVRQQGLGSTVTDVTPLTGGTQNIVVRAAHRRSSDGAAASAPAPPADERQDDAARDRGVAHAGGHDVPHPGFIAGCEDLDVLGVVFYLMEEVDGFNPGSEMAQAYVAMPGCGTTSGLSYAASLAQLGNVEWEGSPLAAIRRPGSFLARQVPQFLGLLESYRHDAYDPGSLPAVTELARVAARPTVRPTASRASCTATPI